MWVVVSEAYNRSQKRVKALESELSQCEDSRDTHRSACKASFNNAQGLEAENQTLKRKLEQQQELLSLISDAASGKIKPIDTDSVVEKLKDVRKAIRQVQKEVYDDQA